MSYPIDTSFWISPTRKAIGGFDEQEFTIWIGNSSKIENQNYNTTNFNFKLGDRLVRHWLWKSVFSCLGLLRFIDYYILHFLRYVWLNGNKFRLSKLDWSQAHESISSGIVAYRLTGRRPIQLAASAAKPAVAQLGASHDDDDWNQKKSFTI